MKRFLCWFIGHKYVIIEERNNSHLFECEKCKAVAMINDVFSIHRYKNFAEFTKKERGSASEEN